jgi:nucleoside-diphosphate-sugar epimerase
MNILVTGGSGFLGARLTQALLRVGALSVAGAPSLSIKRLLLTDLNDLPQELRLDPRVEFCKGPLQTVLQEGLPAREVDLVFHLAAAVSAECEADFDLGMSSNLQATIDLLQACRASGCVPTVVFASSVAVFGRRSGESWDGVTVDDDTLPTPQSSYGIQKFVGEQLMADFGRKRYIKARTVRLMTVSVRPGRPNGAASGFLSGMIREPLAGLRARVPVDATTPVALSSPARSIEGLIRAAQASDEEWGPLTAMNLPSLTTTVGAMADTLLRKAGPAAHGLLDWAPDPAVGRIVGGWPSRLQASRARGLGLLPDASFDDIVEQYMLEQRAL